MGGYGVIEQRYRDFREALGIIRMIAGLSHDRLNVLAAWTCVGAYDSLRRKP